MKKTSTWGKIKYLLNVYRELKKAARPKTIAGTRIIIFAIASSPIVSWGLVLVIESVPFLSEVEIVQNQKVIWSLFLNTLALVFGMGLIWYDIRQEERQSRKAALLIINGLPNMKQVFPKSILSAAEEMLAREPIELSFKSEDIKKQVEMYNAEAKVELISRFVTHHGCQKLYIGGLARVPFLVGYGAMLRNTSGVTYFEKMHSKGGEWCLLDDEDECIELFLREENISANDEGAVGIALGMSTEIVVEQLPTALQQHTLFIDASGSIKKDKVKNQANLQRISETVAQKIDVFSTKAEVNVIHLFLSVQSTLALEIGRRYQEGTQKPWIIHNYDPKQHCYPWALRLTGQVLTLE